MQNYSNHIRLNPLHHFVILPLTVFVFGWTLYRLFTVTEITFTDVFYVLLSFSILLIGFIARIYALKNQDRIIRLEMRVRYFELTGKSFSETEKKLSLSQVIALRFASNDELLILIEKAISEQLKSKEIKKQIKDWQADLHRV
jgi:hypothetical protein